MAVVHRTYARALYEAARDAKSIPVVREQLADFVAATETVPDLHALLVNPKLDARFKRSTLEAVLADADTLLRNFLLLLVEKNRAGDVEEIAREFEQIAAADEGRLDVELTTAYEPPGSASMRPVRSIRPSSAASSCRSARCVSTPACSAASPAFATN